MVKYKTLAIVLFLAGLGLFLSRVFSGSVILPRFFHLGPLVIHYYGLTMALAVAAGFYLAARRAPKNNIGRKAAEDLLFWVIAGGFLGARIYHVLSSINFYWHFPLEIFKVWQGGLSIFGAVFGGLIVILILSKNYKLKTLNLIDWLAPSVLLGQIIGRFGNLFNYEAFGYPTGLPWKMFVPQNFRPVEFYQYNFFHPWFAYEILGNVFIFLILKKYCNNRKPGVLFFSYFLMYNALRFALEFLRIDSTFFGQFRLNSLVSLTLALFSILMISLLARNNTNGQVS